MQTLERPKLRPLSARRVEHGGQAFVALEDSLRLLPRPFLLPLDPFRLVIRHFDGRSTLDEIRTRVRHETGLMLAVGELRGLVEQLDAAMVLDGPTYAAFRDGYRRETIRPAVFAGAAYPGDPAALTVYLDDLFRHPQASGPFRRSSARSTESGTLRAVLSPHIDFTRGGPVYTHAYHALAERSDAEVFVVLGVAHQYTRHRFVLTTKDFQTPLGTARTDRAFVETLADRAGQHLFDDELAHRTEHSIEFQAVFLQHVLGPDRPFTIVPILVGSFHDLMHAGLDPIADNEVARFVEALRTAEKECGKRVAYVGGVDFGHIGREFGDPHLLDNPTLEGLRQADTDLLNRASEADPAGWFASAARIGDRWRVCGLAATYTLLRTLGPVNGRVLRYDQAVNPERTCCVSFASMTFESPAE